MCCNNFWKKITVFSITLLIGFFAVEFVKFQATKCTLSAPTAEKIDDLSLQKSSPVLPQSKRKNCVPADSSLKYQTLPYDGSEVEAREIDTGKLIEILSAIEKIKLDKNELEKSGKNNDEAIETEIKRLDREREKLYELLHKYDNFLSEQNLLYVEKCSEYGESMKVMPPMEK